MIGIDGGTFLRATKTRSIALDSAKDALMLKKNSTSPSAVNAIAGFSDRAVSTSLKPDARKLYKRNILDGLGWRSLRFRERRSQRCATSLDSARLNRVTNKNSYRSKRIPRCRNQPPIAPRRVGGTLFSPAWPYRLRWLCHLPPVQRRPPMYQPKKGTHYSGRHGRSRVAKVVLVGAVPPLMLKTQANPEGTPLEVLDGIRKGVAGDRSQFHKDLTMPFYGFNREGAKVNDGLRNAFWLHGMQGSIKGQYDCVREFSEVDYTDDLRKIDKPTLIIHGYDDQIVPIKASAAKTAKIVKGAQLKAFAGGSHGLAQVEPDKFTAAVLP